ncbi:hypothetical protein AVEN_186413-1 [Araneus ventricosus]|uniref:Uncharacterized protein n=1 Tax=Araneus ventricosus TaxID=182803 RepID=A0A4Y2D144_ARAVE|nr:hypothetical protein AVEN_186413-1 [Araneus ventricosus]
MKHDEVSRMYREIEYSPYCFVADDVSPHLILVDFIYVIFSTGEFGAMSDPLLTYLMDLTELQYSTLICSMKIFVNKGQNGIIQVLSTYTFNPLNLMFAVNPPS